MFTFHPNNSTKDLAFFDIRLKTGGHKNTVLVKGNEFEVDRIPIDGHVKILTQEDLHVKNVKLLLVCEYHMDYYDRTPSGHIGGQVFEKDCALKVIWPNLLTSADGEIVFGNYGENLIKLHKLDHYIKKLLRDNLSSDLRSLGSPNASLTNLSSDSNSRLLLPKRPGYLRTNSLSALSKNQEKSLFTIPKSGVDGTPFPLMGPSDHHSFLLPEGNYSMPFSVNLPTNVPESIEGLTNVKVLYKLECIIERGRFERSFHTGKHFRIVRTLHPRNLNLVDSIEFNNTWPGKVEFKVSIPKKGLAMGTSVPIELVMVPLAKGLSFKSMTAEIVQHHHMVGITGRSPEFEKVGGRERLKCDTSECDEDHWVVKGMYHLPSSLNQITQTCTLKNDMVDVKHRIRVSIHIKNADGHVSELRANLPVHIFMSPYHGRITTRHLEVDSRGNFTSEQAPDREDVIFHHSYDNDFTESPEDSSSEAEYDADRETDGAPPLYQLHKQDTLYDYTSPQTPLEQLRSHGIAVESYFDLPQAGSGASTPPLDLNVLLRVPSYEHAVEDDSDDDGEELAPLYPLGSDSGVSSPLSLSPSPYPGLGDRSASMTNLLFHKDRHSSQKHASRLMFLRKEHARASLRG
ncbi:CIC11C00000005271 [Sungouiella intermedia]|uniref:CIC11C00000003338 n=1 Tax=Sungouiella intermedia TaxID=45354 RepID=A0A1L0DJ91_9ASCO|nr:CIC11C00000005271 [[Candida] intermedia]SGZ56620.1 CIC11C00000003338 [[Candida] intermedia]